MKAYLKPLLILIPVIFLLVFFYLKEKEEMQAVPQSVTSTQGVSSLELKEVTDWKGQKIDLSKYPESNLVVHFWASWCGPCVHEFPDLIEMTKRQNGKAVVLAIAEDKDLKEVEAFVKSFPQALNTDHFYIVWDQDRSYMKQWNVEKLPESYIYSPDRNLAKRVSGAVSWTNEDAEGFFKLILERKKAE